MTGADDAPAPPLELDDSARQFVEEFGLLWEKAQSTRMEGRITGLLMIVDAPYLSSAQIAHLLQASAGAVSTSTRVLVEVGFIKRHVIPGDRNHYFRVEDDIWGSFLAGERAYLMRLAEAIEVGFAALDGDGDTGRRRRMINAHNYMTWLSDYHRTMLKEWVVYRDSHASQTPGADRRGAT
ncbi:GbsR/MarR family transcriptional regulator [Actinotalea sp. C106]|uniref:GbsR/MarR family transcriptional regulator n=1 Tax=Actinotalea sp. C106 TaxID=2908644 RepID=UPI002028702B|nr:transcriptional regulator [Actinotalea sp. C106]